MWKYNGSHWTWVTGSNGPIVDTADSPGSRFEASAWTDKQGNLWLFAGQGPSKICFFNALGFFLFFVQHAFSELLCTSCLLTAIQSTAVQRPQQILTCNQPMDIGCAPNGSSINSPWFCHLGGLSWRCLSLWRSSIFASIT